MSKEARKKVYDELVKEGRLDRDDGALEKEFGPAPTIKEPFKEPEKPKKKGKK